MLVLLVGGSWATTTGRVLTNAGQPFKGVIVTATDQSRVFNGVTDDQGKFKIQGPGQGAAVDYKVSAGGYGINFQSADSDLGDITLWPSSSTDLKVRGSLAGANPMVALLHIDDPYDLGTTAVKNSGVYSMTMKTAGFPIQQGKLYFYCLDGTLKAQHDWNEVVFFELNSYSIKVDYLGEACAPTANQKDLTYFTGKFAPGVQTPTSTKPTTTPTTTPTSTKPTTTPTTTPTSTKPTTTPSTTPTSSKPTTTPTTTPTQTTPTQTSAPTPAPSSTSQTPSPPNPTPTPTHPTATSAIPILFPTQTSAPANSNFPIHGHFVPNAVATPLSSYELENVDLKENHECVKGASCQYITLAEPGVELSYRAPLVEPAVTRLGVKGWDQDLGGRVVMVSDERNSEFVWLTARSWLNHINHGRFGYSENTHQTSYSKQRHHRSLHRH